MEQIRLRTAIAIAIATAVFAVVAVVGAYSYWKLQQPLRIEHRLFVEQIEDLGRLELIRMPIKDILTSTKERPFYLPDAKALIMLVGEVYAGIDLKKVKKEDIEVSDTKVTIKLPAPEIFISRVNHAKSKVYDVSWGGFSSAQITEEAYKSGEIKLREAAVEAEFAEACKTNARTILTAIFGKSSGKTVVIEFKS